ncbi:MAG: EAL domain-containing protein [Pseudolabrys sp.]|nr:EAL domain-containing protein [Pseudolabrys sp.]
MKFPTRAPKTPMLRNKLLAAFAAMAVLTALCGGIGLLLLNRIGDAVTVYADITSPLQSETLSLVDAARRMRDAVQRELDGEGAATPAAEEIAALDKESRDHIASLARLDRMAGIDIDFGTLQSLESEYALTLRRMLEANVARRSTQIVNIRRRDAVDEFHRSALAILNAITSRAEAELNEIEERVKTEQQAGRARLEDVERTLGSLLTEISPRLNNARKIASELDQIADLAALAMQTDLAGLESVGANIQQTLRLIRNATARLQGRLRDEPGQAEFARLKTAFDNLQAALTGQDGLMFRVREALQANAIVDEGRLTLAQIERQYFAILANVRRDVATINQSAQARAHDSLGSATRVMIIGGVLAIIAALALATFFSRRITRPLTLLADHAAAIRQSGELTPLPEGNAGHYDEVDKLTHAFNEMVAELAAAKSRLIAWSEGEIRKQYERLDTAINSMPLGLCMFDREQRLIICNRRYAQIYGLSEDQTRPGTPLEKVLKDRVNTGLYTEPTDNFIEDRLAIVHAGKPWYGINELRTGRVIAVSHQPLVNGGSIAIHEDITDRRESELRIEHMAHHDALTDLPNRTRFRDEIAEALSRVERGETLAVLCLDLDHFKDVNDTLGHPIGDALLRQVAERLRGCIRPTDAIARLGGDEFAIVQTGAEQPVSATAIANRLIKEIAVPFEIEGHQIVIGASVGIAIAPNDGTDPDGLLKKADMALYRAKEDGRGAYRFFEPEMDARMQNRRAMELDLRKALALNEFQVYYQPLIDIETGQVACFEALLRWHHPERGMVPPNDFIPLAEEIGLINQIGAWVLKEACNEAVKWPDHIRVAVNLSAVQFKSKTLVLDVVAALAESGLQRGRLEVEITETVLLQDTDTTIETLNHLRDLGVRISMDDFGTGYSSLGYLRKFPFDKIKIDRSFVGDLEDEPDSIAIVRAVAGLGNTLGISTTAEGVETPEQLEQLRAEGCTEAQGYLISKPRPGAELSDLIAEIEKGAVNGKIAASKVA